MPSHAAILQSALAEIAKVGHQGFAAELTRLGEVQGGQGESLKSAQVATVGRHRVGRQVSFQTQVEQEPFDGVSEGG